MYNSDVGWIDAGHIGYAQITRERRYLLNDLPEPLTRSSEHLQIWDNFITNTRLRLRQVRNPVTKEFRWAMIQKAAVDPNDLAHAQVSVIELSKYEYDAFSSFEGNEVRKNRYAYESCGRVFSIDVFLGTLWGLVVSKTAFDTDDEMNSLSLTPFTATEVTGNELFYGARLCDTTIEELNSKIEV